MNQVSGLNDRGRKDKIHKIAEYLDSRPYVVKGILLSFCTFVGLLALLIMPLFSYGDNAIDLKISISGLGLFKAIIDGYKITSNTSEFGEIVMTIPKTPLILTALGIICILGVFILSLSMLFIAKDRKDRLWSKITSLAFLLVSIYLIVLFLVFISSENILAEDIYGNKKPFYQVFSFTPTILLNILGLTFLSAITFFLKENDVCLMRRKWQMYLFLLIPTALMVIYSLYPMFLAIVLSLKEYTMADGVWGSAWYGLNNFKKMFIDPQMLTIIGNTLLISLSRMLVSIIPPMILAIFLFDMYSDKYRKCLQTIIYIPHFFSWVVIYGIAYAFISPEGMINKIIELCGGNRISILSNESVFIPLLLLTDMWKELGWGTILYLAALTNIDTTLYEAASIDGAGPVKRIFKITIPGIAPTIVFVSIMAVGNLFKGAGFEQIMLFGNEHMNIAQVIDTWVYWQGLQKLNYGLGAAVSFVQSFMGMVMVIGCNYLSKKTVGVGLY